MIFEFCIAGVITFFYYTRRFFQRLTNRSDLHGKSIISPNKDKMSDDEFCDPAGASHRWRRKSVTVNVINSPQQKGIFRWKRQNPETLHMDSPASKRQKSNAAEIIELTDDDESESNITDDSTSEQLCNCDKKNQVDSLKTPLKNVVIKDDNDDSPVILIDDDPITNDIEKKSKTNKNLSSVQQTLMNDYFQPKSGKLPKYKRSCEEIIDVPNPPGMPPMISGIPVKFPIKPYKSQISVMNAVIQGCKNQQHCLLESPTGSGKTLSLLCSALAWQENYKGIVHRDAERSIEEYAMGLGGSGGSSMNHGSESSEFNKQKELEEPEDPSAMFENMDGKHTEQKRVPKIYYGSRTHKQIEQVIREFKKTAYKNKPMTILSSREHTCLQGEKGVNKTLLCNDLLDKRKKSKGSGGCIYYRGENKARMATHSNLKRLGLETPWDIEDLVECGKDNVCCPYFSARDLMEGAEIIFCPYNYLIDPVIRETMRICLVGDIVIVDEAHNMEDICRNVGSTSFREDALSEAIEDCENVNKSKVNPANHLVIIKLYLSDFIQIIHDQHLGSVTSQYEELTSDCWTGEQAWTLFRMKKLADENFSQFKRACNQAIEEYKTLMEDLANKDDPSKKAKKDKELPESSINANTMKILQELLNSLDYIRNPEFAQDFRCIVTKSYCSDAKIKAGKDGWIKSQKAIALNTFKFLCMNPGVIFSLIAKQARTVILASGTLSPTSTFESELGTKFGQKLSASHVVPKEQVYVRGISKGPKGTILKATYDNVQTFPFKDDLGRLMLEICDSIPYGVLCFFSSYSMMTSQIDRWRETDVWNQLNRHKLVLQEPRSNTNLDDVMNQFRVAIHDSSVRSQLGVNGALLLAVFRGKVAEGIDFSDNEARCVISIGIPYAVRNTPAVKYKIEYNNLHRNKGLLAGGEWYTVQAFRALNQALGRCIRHKNDWGAILLVDERLNSSGWSNKSSEYLPKWIREMKLEGQNYNLKKDLNLFVKYQNIRDEERAAEE